MPKILIMGAAFAPNRGSAAMLEATIQTLRTIIPEADFAVLSPFPDSDSEFAEQSGVRVVRYDRNKLLLVNVLCRSLLRRIFRVNGTSAVNPAVKALLEEFCEADVVLDLSGDGFSDEHGAVQSLLSCYDICISVSFGKPFVIYAQSIGPFNSMLTRALSRYWLNKVALLLVRENVTRQYLRAIGVTNAITTTADSAFLLRQAPERTIQAIFLKENIDANSKPLIGISVSSLMQEQREKTVDDHHRNRYVALMASLADYFAEHLNARIILVSHVIRRNGIDDRFVASQILKMVNKKSSVAVVSHEYTAAELKGIIAHCDLFVGGRMHANIAALSTCVPTLALAYSPKSYGIMQQFGLGEFVVNYDTVTLEELISKTNDLWNRRDFVRSMLSRRLELVKKCAAENAALVKKLIEAQP